MLEQPPSTNRGMRGLAPLPGVVTLESAGSFGYALDLKFDKWEISVYKKK